MRRFRANSIRMFVREDSGVGLLEFGLAATVLFMVIFGIMDGARALYADHYVSNVAREASRYAMVRGSTWGGASCATSGYSCTATSTDVANYVKSITPMGFSASSLSVNTTWPGTTPSGASCSATNTNNSPGCVVMVRINYSFNFVLPFLPKNTLVLSSTSSLPIAQ